MDLDCFDYVFLQLSSAIHNNDMVHLQWLISRNYSKVDRRAKAMQIAVCYQNIKAVRAILPAWNSLSLQSMYDDCLYSAVIGRNTEITKLLIKIGASVN